MILSSCHDYSLNNDSHCHGHCRCHYMQGVYVYFILPCLGLFCLVLSCLELTSITIVTIGMTLYELVLHYIIISHHIISHVLYCSVLYPISLNDLCLSVRVLLCLCVYPYE